MRGRVQQSGAGGSLPELQPEAGADRHPQGSGSAHCGRVVAVSGGAAVQPAAHLVQGLLPGALRGVPVALHRHQRQVSAGDAAAADRQAGPAVQLHLCAALLPVPAGARHSGDYERRNPGARCLAAHAGHPVGLRAAARTDAAGGAVWGDAGWIPLHCDSDGRDGEEAEAVETGECCTCTKIHPHPTVRVSEIARMKPYGFLLQAPLLNFTSSVSEL